MKKQDSVELIEIDDIGKYIDSIMDKTPKWKYTFWRIINKFKGKRRDWKIKRWTKKTMKLFPFFDYSYFFDMVSIWTKEASKEYTESNVLASSLQTSKELLIASDLFERLAYGYNEENEYDFWKEKYGGFTKIPDHRFESIRKRITSRNEQDSQYLFSLIKRKYQKWWE